MLQTLRSTQRPVPGMYLTTIPKIVLVPRKSDFLEWCYVPDVRILAPPVAKIQKFSVPSDKELNLPHFIT